MTVKLGYSSNLNGASYLLFELKQIVKVQQKFNLTPKEIRKKVIDENIFQFENKKRVYRVLPSVMRRFKVIDSTLASLLVEGTPEMSKVINLYAIMKTDLLFFEFMDEVIKEKFQNNDYVIEKSEVNLFFTAKSEQSSKIAEWSDINIEKLKSAFMQVLFESGILKNRFDGELNRLIIDDQIKNHIIYIGDARYIHAMGE